MSSPRQQRQNRLIRLAAEAVPLLPPYNEHSSLFVINEKCLFAFIEYNRTASRRLRQGDDDDAGGFDVVIERRARTDDEYVCDAKKIRIRRCSF